jgi:hypothetical protein
MVWIAGIAVIVALQIVVVLFVVHRNRSTASPSTGNGGTTVTTIGGGGNGGSGPTGGDAVPGVGGDVFLAGGVARMPIPDGWRLVARGDRLDDPGGYSENAVILHQQAGVTIGAFLRADPVNPVDAAATLDAAARTWVRDAQQAQVDAVQGGGGTASVRYRYIRTGPVVEGEAVISIRADGTTLVVFVDSTAGTFESARGTWQPLRDAVVSDFAA